MVAVGTLRLPYAWAVCENNKYGLKGQKIIQKLYILDLSQNVRFRAIPVLSVPPSGHILIANALSDVMTGFSATDEQDVPKIVLETFLNSKIL